MKLQRMTSTCLTLLLFFCAIATFIAAPAAEVADAAKNKDAAALQALLKQRADVNAAQADGTTALHWAAHWNDLDTVNALLRAGANAKSVNRYGASPLSEAVSSGNAALVLALLNAGADAKTLTTPDGETVLMTAARAGNLEAVRVLLDRGADVNAREKYKGQTALMWAAAERHTPVVKLLLERGADWKIRSSDKETRLPALSAASSVTPLTRGGFPALLYTAREGDIPTAQAMLDAGVDINYGDVDNTTALTVAILNKQYSLAKFLVDRGTDVTIADAAGRTALYAIVDIRNEDWTALPLRKAQDSLPSIEVLKAILSKKPNVNTTLNKVLPGKSGMDGGDTTLGAGTTALMRAARSGDAPALRLLLAAGADPKLMTRDGNNAFMFAAGIGYRDKNTTGTEAEALEAVKVMLDTGQDVNQANPRGENSLHGAASRGADTIVQFLVDHGAKLNEKTRQGLTPLDYALGRNVVIQLPVPHESTVALIRKLGGVEGKDLK